VSVWAEINEVRREKIEELLREVDTMTSLGHHGNVIELIGCASTIDGEKKGKSGYINVRLKADYMSQA